jgi:glycerol-3-phosphate acyltransferase PlsY
MFVWLFYTLLGWICGSVLFARLASHLFHKPDIIIKSKDHNPGTANAFHYGGFWIGCFVLIGDFFKAFLPVWLYFYNVKTGMVFDWYSGIVCAAPVLGHTFPLWNEGKGGKGIAVSFGAFAGLWAGLFEIQDLALLIGLFLFFVLIVRIKPDYWLTVTVYALYLIFCPFFAASACALWSGWLVSLIILIRMMKSKEKKRKNLKVYLLWKPLF